MRWLSFTTTGGSAISRSYMKANSGPFVPKQFVCNCRVPVWIGVDNFWKGWGETVCLKCKHHGLWGMVWARLYPNVSRSQILKLEGVSS